MTREERAEKWFRGIPNAELISMQEKMNICDKAAREMMTDIFLMSAATCIALLVFCGKMIFDLLQIPYITDTTFLVLLAIKKQISTVYVGNNILKP